MSAELYGLKPSGKTGVYFRSNFAWWQGLRLLISVTCEDFLTDPELIELDFNNGTQYDKEKTDQMAERLAEIAEDDEILGSYENQIMAMLPDMFAGCWSKAVILELVGFLRNCGGFELY